MIVAACATATPRPRSNGGALSQIEAARDLDGHAVGTAARPTLLVVFASWCASCRHELDVLAALRTTHPELRILGIDYRGHEDYDHRGDAAAVRAYVAGIAPWLRVVPIDDVVFEALGRPPMIPTIFVYDRRGELVATFDRRDRLPPGAAELEPLLARITAP